MSKIKDDSAILIYANNITYTNLKITYNTLNIKEVSRCLK